MKQELSRFLTSKTGDSEKAADLLRAIPGAPALIQTVSARWKWASPAISGGEESAD